MLLEEFSNLVNHITGPDFPIREIPLCFNSSIALQVDEIYDDRHYSMIFSEFIESLCRVIDIESPVSVKEKVF